MSAPSSPGMSTTLIGAAPLPQRDARSRRRGASSVAQLLKRSAAAAGAVAKDVGTVALVAVLVPLVLCVFVPLCALPFFDWMLHRKREYLDGVSACYINQLEDCVIHGMFIFKERVSSETLFADFKETYMSGKEPAFAKFTQRIVRRSWLWPYWAEAEVPFDNDYHFRVVEDAVSKDDMEARLAEIELQPFDFQRPVWQIWHFVNYTDESGVACSATMLRIHHAWADGFTGMRVIMQGARPNKPPTAPAPARSDRRKHLGPLSSMHYCLKSLRKLILLPEDRPSAVKANTLLGKKDPRVVAWSALPNATVSDLKQLGKNLGGATINDLLLAALSVAIKRHGEQTSSHDKPGLPADVTAATWVSRTPLKHIYSDFDEMPFKWGNSSLGCFYLPLPVAQRPSSPPAAEVLADIRAHTSDPSLMLESVGAHLVMSLIGGYIPRAAGSIIWPSIANKVSVSLSNVPGPQFDFAWCGAPVKSLLFFVPPTGTVSLFVTIVTLNGQVNVGMGADASLISQGALRSIVNEFFSDGITSLMQEAEADKPPAGQMGAAVGRAVVA